MATKMSSTQAEAIVNRPPLLWSCRLTMVLMSFLAIFHLFLMRFNLSIGLVCMTTNGTDIENYFGDSQSWNKEVQGSLLSAFFYGYLCTQILGGYISDRIGGKFGLLIGLAFMSLGSIILPPLARINQWFVFIIRLMQGLVSGLAFPSVYNLFSVWTSPEERATLMSIVYSAVAGATVVNFPLSSLLCETGLAGGWPMIFYIPGASGLILSVVFYQVAFSSPANHPRISIEEQKYLLVSCRQSVRQGEDKLKVPWLALVKSVPLYALCVTHMSFSWCFYLTAVNIPLLAKEVFNMGVMEIGMMSALPYIGMMFMSSTGKLFDILRKMNLVSLTNLRKIFNTVAFVIPAVSMFSLRLLNKDDSLGAIILLTVTMSFLQISTTGGFFLSHSELAGPYSGLIFGITNTAAQIPGFVTALMVAYLTPNGSREEWLNVYDIAGLICLIGASTYLAFGTTELQPWATTTTMTTNSKKSEA